MSKPFLLFAVLLLSFPGFAQTTSPSSARSAPSPAQSNDTAQIQSPTGTREGSAIRKVLGDQVLAWNRGSVDDFMKSYWNNDSLLFVGKDGISYGYATTLAHYKKDYSDPDKMGKLFFSLLEVKRLSAEHYFVIGKWLLKRKAGDLSGIFSLLFRKINGHWLIIADHTS